MNLRNLWLEKQAWRATQRQIKALPDPYQVVYREIQRYYWHFTAGTQALAQIAGLFAEAATAGRSVLAVTGPDVAAFADAMLAAVDE